MVEEIKDSLKQVSITNRNPPKAFPDSMEEATSSVKRKPSLPQMPSEQQKQERAMILSQLHEETASAELRAYLKRLEAGSTLWDRDTFIEGIRCIAGLCGSGRAKYYTNLVKGLHYQHTFTEQWNRSYPRQPITLWDQDFRRQCPPGWSSDLKDGNIHWTLTLQEDIPLSQALNRLLICPTTIDCGMCSALMLWFAIRYVIGDRWLDKFFKFRTGTFCLTQIWEEKMSTNYTTGNLLYPFYDNPFLGMLKHPVLV